MRYAIVIEKAEGVAADRQVSRPISPGMRRRRGLDGSERLRRARGHPRRHPRSTSPGCGRTACRCRLRRASRITSRPERARHKPPPAAGKRPISGRCRLTEPGSLPMNAPVAIRRLQAHAAVSRRQGHDALPQAQRRRRAGREGHGQGRRRGLARGVARARGGRLHRHQPSAAAGPSQAAARDPRRPRGLRQRQVRRLRFLEERQHRRRRRAADVPGHRHRHHHGQEGPARLDRRRRRGGARRGRPRRLPQAEPALFAARAALDVRGEEHQQQHAGADRDLRGRRGRLQVPVRRQGRRLRQQVVPVPGDARRSSPATACSRSSRRRCSRSAPRPARPTTSPSSSAAPRPSSP